MEEVVINKGGRPRKEPETARPNLAEESPWLDESLYTTKKFPLVLFLPDLHSRILRGRERRKMLSNGYYAAQEEYVAVQRRLDVMEGRPISFKVL